MLPQQAVGSYPAFSPLLAEAYREGELLTGGIFSVALSVTEDLTSAPAFSDGRMPCVARTFLPRISAGAIEQPVLQIYSFSTVNPGLTTSVPFPI